MEYRTLGRSGLKVSIMALGTANFGGAAADARWGQLETADARRFVDIALDAGVNLIDTADVYSGGASETMLGEVVRGRRDELLISTKVRFRSGPGPNDVGLSRHHIVTSCEASLRRLRTDWIDLYQAHEWDGMTPLEETLEALDDLVRTGKVRYLGCSNYAAWQLMKALSISDAHNLERFVTLQALYSLIARDLEIELVPLSLDQKLGILPWSPLGGGFLTGKYRRGKPRPEGARRSDATNQFLQFDEEKGFDIVDELEKIAGNHQATITQAALNYLLRKPGVTSVIIGAKTKEQLMDDLKAAAWEMTADEVARLDELSKPPRVYPDWMLERLSQDR